MHNKSVYACLFLLLVLVIGTNAQTNFTSWPKGTIPEEVGEKVAVRFLVSPHGKYNTNDKAHIPYFEVCTWYGALRFAKETSKTALTSQLEERFQPLFSTKAHLLPEPNHVDFNVFGALALELYIQTANKKYLTLGLPYADSQWNLPTDSVLTERAMQYFNQGYSWQTRLWIDDMYMITMVQSQVYRVTRDKNYIDRAAREMVLYLEQLQQPNGLFYHAPKSPFFWGRGNGWMAAGMTELLRALPPDNPHRPAIMEAYKKMMQTLLSYQTEDGAWRQLVDDPASWKESSCTGMFTFAMIAGVKNGWLEKEKYEPAARKGWHALVSFINEKGEVQEVCEGTGAGNSKQYYYDRKRITGDMHGQAPVLWCAAALTEKD